MGFGSDTGMQRETGHLAQRVTERFVRIAGDGWEVCRIAV